MTFVLHIWTLLSAPVAVLSLAQHRQTSQTTTTTTIQHIANQPKTMAAKLLHILSLIAVVGSCLAQNGATAVATDAVQMQQRETYYAPTRQTSAMPPPQPPPPAVKSSLSNASEPTISPSSSSSSSASSQPRQDTNMANYEDLYGGGGGGGGLRLTATKTPAPWIIPEHTKIPVAVSESSAAAAAAATGVSDPGFVLLGAAVGVIMLGMGLV